MDMNGPNSRIGVQLEKLKASPKVKLTELTEDAQISCIGPALWPNPRLNCPFGYKTFDTVSQVCVHMVTGFYAP